MSRYERGWIPDVAIPQDSPPSMDNLLIRENSAIGELLLKGSADTLAEAGQCRANLDDLVDNYPLGRPRNDITLEQAHRIAQGLGTVARL